MKKNRTLLIGICALLLVPVVAQLPASISAQGIRSDLIQQEQESARDLTKQATNIHLELSPPAAYLHLQPGQRGVHTISITNKSQDPQVILPQLVDFETNGKDNQVLLKSTLSHPYATFENIPTPFILNPGQKFSARVLFDIPKDLPPQELHITALFFTQKPDTTQSAVSGGIGSNIILAVNSDTSFESSLSIASNSTPSIQDSFQALNVQIAVANQGPFAASLSGVLTLTPWWSSSTPATQVAVYPDTVLSNSSRVIRGTDPQQPTTPTPLTLDPGFALGIYTLQLTLKSASGDVIVTQKIMYAPFGLLLILFLGMLLMGFYLILQRMKPPRNT